MLDSARQLLPEVGPTGVTYTLLSDRTGVTRQTLYRHWPTIESLFVDLVLAGPDNHYPSPDTDADTVVTEFLTSLRAGMNDPPTAAALMALAAQADRHAPSRAALASIATDRCAALNILLTNTGRTVEPDEFARLVGPVMFQRFLAQPPVSDRLIEATVTAWLDSTPPDG